MRKAIPPLAVALVGAATAYLMLVIHPAVGLLPLAVAAFGWWRLKGAKRTAESDPLGALEAFEQAQLLPYALAALASAGLIFLAVLLAPPEAPAEGTPPPTEQPLLPRSYLTEIMKAVAGAVSAFITAAWIKSAEEPDSWVAGQVEDCFRKVFAGRFPEKSDARNAVLSSHFGGHAGWGREGRASRAKAIADALQHSRTAIPG